ncbi:Pectate lyase superfamily protein [Chryseobacterium arachidis]|uniref:Pectate lyase superfamily protein n=1 Tax=Chryseobacterium arachidis TaxID=1416778 RepID=A0A1M4UAS9_9FLAO|nr:glycosyl hydrolase family 28-related protein [Chryseobacterium arachidis]SHE53663.1 Pectate lyase superfamily protein [Chryseobacterium arachidis]
MYTTQEFFSSTNTIPLDPLVQLRDSLTNENVFYIRCDSATGLIDDGVIYRKSVDTFYKRQIDNAVNIKWFGVKGDGYTDDTIGIKRALQTVYNLSEPISTTLGWRNPTKIFIPSGKYLVKDNIIDASVDCGRFVFEGNGWQNTEIIYEPVNNDVYMLENPGVIGFCTFQGIQFTTNHEGNFLNGVGGGTGNAQSFIFEKCFFQNWKQIIKSTGSTMMSEVTFRDCKIKGSNANSILFSLGNDQAVNWRFYGTDIEGFKGILFDFLEGQNINYYQGSIIPFEGTIIRVNANANPDTFGGGTQPHIAFWGSRFELHNGAKLIQVFNNSVDFTFKFDSCGMGGHSIGNGLPVVETKGKGTIIFDTCSNWMNYKFSHHVDDAEDYLSPLRIIYKNMAPSIAQIDESICNSLINVSSYPIYIFDNCNSNSWYRPWKKSAQNSSYGWPVSKHISGVYPNSDGVLLPVVSMGNTYEINLSIPNQYITDRKIVFKKASDIGGAGYYSQVHNIKVYDKTNTVLLAEGNFDSDKGLILHDDRAGLLHENDKYVIRIKPVIFSGGDLVIGINLISEY